MFQVRLEASTDLLRAAGEDPATVLSPERRAVRPLLELTFAVVPHTTVIEEPTVANVVGVLEGSDPTLRNEAVVFTGHMDHVGFAGKDYTSLGALVDRLAREHPELRLAPKEHEGIYAASDHFPFAQRGVPALFFFSGVHDDLHAASDNVNPVGIEQATRITKLDSSWRWTWRTQWVGRSGMRRRARGWCVSGAAGSR